MTHRLPQILRIASVAISLAALGVYAVTVALPYRLSPSSGRILEVALPVQAIGSIVALLTSLAAYLFCRFHPERRSGLLGVFSIMFALAVLLLVIMTAHVHSTSREPSAEESSNKPDPVNPAMALWLTIKDQ